MRCGGEKTSMFDTDMNPNFFLWSTAWTQRSSAYPRAWLSYSDR